VLALVAAGIVAFVVDVLRQPDPPPATAGSSVPPATDSATGPTHSAPRPPARRAVPRAPASPEQDHAAPAGTEDRAAVSARRAAVTVVVLNQTTVSGLAAAVAEDLRRAGWQVIGTGNFHGAVPSSTVYYPEDAERAAEALASDIPGPDRVRPRFGNLSTSRLTVVLAEDVRDLNAGG